MAVLAHLRCVRVLPGPRTLHGVDSGLSPSSAERLLGLCAAREPGSRSDGYCLMTINQEARIGPCGPRPRPPPAAGGGAPAGGGGAGPRSGWNRYTLCVFSSTVIVFAPANVGTVATTVYL